ncbi:polysaccharide biosynthesis tyrosine autokinase [Serratia fonticola]|uniref:polysaccharide biosynthesis tyrosine autokinase n=1 Tax=Serratia fonticola TaxID=47917 RepID=UPI0021ADD4AF|nr:polysaccharide biosynthesis tyrosine autokinase [Serratia fonticola]
MLDKGKVNHTNDYNNEGIDLLKIVGAVIDSKWLITSIASIFVAITITYLLFATPIYQSNALVQVEQNVGSSILSNLSDILPTSEPPSASEIELIQSRMILGKTVDDLHLDIEVNQKHFPFFGQGWARLTNQVSQRLNVEELSVPRYLLDQKMLLKIIDNKRYELRFEDINGDEKKVEGEFDRPLVENGINLKVKNIDAQPETYFVLEKRNKIDVITDLLESLTVLDKGKDTGILNLVLTGEDPVLISEILNSISNNYLEQNIDRKSAEAQKSLNFIDEKLPQLRAELNEAETGLNAYRQKNDSVDLTLETKSVLDGLVQIDAQLNDLTFKEAEISKLYTKEHPSYRALMEQRRSLELDKELLNKRVSSLPKTQQEILRLTRTVEANQDVYMKLLNKQQELNITKASTVGNVRIIDPAVTLSKPIKPEKIKAVLFSLFIGTLIGMGYAILKSIFHKGIETPAELEQLGINVYATVPKSDLQATTDESLARTKHRRALASGTSRILAKLNPADLAVEAIRSLRTSLHFATMTAKNNIIMISGSAPGIGKSFISSNLAVVLAQSDKRVLYIDADMRRGYTHEVFSVKNESGLSEILSNQVSVKESVKTTDIPGLDLITRGKAPPNPSELLMGRLFKELMDWASESYDLVLVDTPPILAVTDAAIIGNHCGTSLLVVLFEKNTAKEVEVSINRFSQNGIDIKGVILNGVVKRAAYYNYGYYNYEYKNN